MAPLVRSTESDALSSAYLVVAATLTEFAKLSPEELVAGAGDAARGVMQPPADGDEPRYDLNEDEGNQAETMLEGA